MANKKKPKYKYDRVQFVCQTEQLELLKKLGKHFGDVDRQAVLRIAIKRLAESEGVRA